MERRILLILFPFLLIISHQNGVAHVEMSLTQPPESRVSSQLPSTSPTHGTMSFDTSSIAIPPTIGRRLKMVFSDTTGGEESQAPSPNEAEAPSPISPTTGRRLKMAPFQAFSDSTGGAESQAPSPDSGEADAPSPVTGRRLKTVPILPERTPIAFLDTTGGAEEQGHADSEDEKSGEPMPADGDGGAAEPPSEENSTDGHDYTEDAAAPSPDNSDYAGEDDNAATAEPPSNTAGNNPELLFGHKIPFDFGNFPSDVDPVIKDANKELNQICSKTESPDLCSAAVAPFIDPEEPVGIQKVLDVFINVNSAFAKHILMLVRKTAMAPNTPHEAREVLNGCQNSYKGVVSSYQSSINAIGRNNLGRVNFTLNAVLDDAGDCEDDLKGLHNFQSPVTDLAAKLIKMTKSCIALDAVVMSKGGKKVGGGGEATAPAPASA